jgi:hypothetical protein
LPLLRKNKFACGNESIPLVLREEMTNKREGKVEEIRGSC